MHDDLNSFEQNPSQKICKNLINLKNPINFSKTQNLGQNEWNPWYKKE